MTSSTPTIPPLASLRLLFDAQQRASRDQIAVPLAVRRDRLLRIKALLDDNAGALAQAVHADFGVRSAQLTEIADLFVLRTLLSSTLKNLPQWMKPVKVQPKWARGDLFYPPCGQRFEWVLGWVKRLI